MNARQHNLVTIYRLLTLLLCSGLTLQAQTQFRTRAFESPVKTLTVRNTNNWLLPPMIELGSDEQVEIAFDLLTDHSEYINYSVTHCNADWTPSMLSEMEYLEGFNNNETDNALPSFNTYVPYFHYRLTLPNEKVDLKVSGNYVVTFFRPDRPDQTVATACFYVHEKRVNVYAAVSGDTDRSFREADQQITTRILFPNYDIRTPQTDLKVFVEQNNRPDTKRTVTNPLYRNAAEIIYEHNPTLLFQAGNEYRRFEIVSSKYPGLNVDFIRFDSKVYCATLQKDRSRSGKTYLYDQDQNGRFLIRDVDASDNDTEADYFHVRFNYPTDLPFLNGQLYLLGEFTGNRIDPQFKLTYDPTDKAYKTELLLKEGAYNYQYIVVPNDGAPPTLSPTEGSYWETENEYFTTVYHRPPGARYDRLVGINFYCCPIKLIRSTI